MAGLERAGVLLCKEAQIMSDFRTAYAWMRQQMIKRLGPTPFRGAWPVWAWYKWDGEARPTPDLSAAGHLAPKERGVRLELEVDDSEVLLSDFELWHYVLNYWYLPISLEDADAFERLLEKRGLSRSRPVPISRYHRRIVKSWERIFDLVWHAKGVTSTKRKKSVQACLWFVDESMVKSKTEFVAR